MKKTRFMSVLALTAMISTTMAAPVFAAETATGGTDVTYTANSAAPDQADWLVSYPRKVVLSDFNTTANNGVSLNFKLLDKLTSNDYSGQRTVTISAANFQSEAAMTGGTGTAVMGIANSSRTDITGPDYVLGTMTKKGVGTENQSTGYAYLSSTTNPEGTFTGRVTFTFTDNSI